MVFTLQIRKQGRKVSFKSNWRRCITVTSHVHSSKSNHMNTYNSDNANRNSILPCINVHTKRSSNELVTLYEETDIDSSTSINDENIYDNNASEELGSHQNSTRLIAHKCYDNGINLLNTEEEADVTSIQSINGERMRS